jgi:hypothetical protein
LTHFAKVMLATQKDGFRSHNPSTLKQSSGKTVETRSIKLLTRELKGPRRRSLVAR